MYYRYYSNLADKLDYACFGIVCGMIDWTE